jgi:hypothetical protein
LKVLLNTLAIAFVAIGLPAFLGLGLMSNRVVIPLASLSVFLVADLVADSFAGLDRRNFVRRIGSCVLTGWAVGIAILFAALLAMNVMIWTGSRMLPSTIVLTDALVLSLAASVPAAGVAVMVRRKISSAHTAKLVLKMILVAVTLGSLYGCNQLSLTTSGINSLTWVAAAFFLVNGAALLALASNGLRSRDSHGAVP